MAEGTGCGCHEACVNLETHAGRMARIPEVTREGSRSRGLSEVITALMGRGLVSSAMQDRGCGCTFYARVLVALCQFPTMSPQGHLSTLLRLPAGLRCHLPACAALSFAFQWTGPRVTGGQMLRGEAGHLWERAGEQQTPSLQHCPCPTPPGPGSASILALSQLGL